MAALYSKHRVTLHRYPWHPRADRRARSAAARTTLLSALRACTRAAIADTVGAIAVAKAPAIGSLSLARIWSAEQRTGSIDVAGTMAVADALRGLISPYTYHVAVSSGGMCWSNHCGYRRYHSFRRGPSHQQSQFNPWLLCRASTVQHFIATRSNREPTTEHNLLLLVPRYS